MRPVNFQLLVSLWIIPLSASDATIMCTDLDPTQYLCKNYAVDPVTQQSVTCAADNSVQVMCESADYINCIGKQHGVFNKTIPDACHYGAHINYTTAVLLSIFLGFFGIDRIYLGYYALGFVKMFSMGGLVVFWLVDIVLISLQLLGPADGTEYAMAYYGPKVQRIRYVSYHRLLVLMVSFSRSTATPTFHSTPVTDASRRFTSLGK